MMVEDYLAGRVLSRIAGIISTMFALSISFLSTYVIERCLAFSQQRESKETPYRNKGVSFDS
jgi:hypothetical protein